MNELYWICANSIDDLESMIETMRKHNLHLGLRQIETCMKKLQELIGSLSGNEKELIEVASEWNIGAFMNTLVSLQECQEAEDYILYADLCELQLIPLLQDLLSLIRDRFDIINARDWTEANSRIVTLNINSDSSNLECTVEPTNSGWFTMMVADGQNVKYIHSNHNPKQEARHFAAEYYDVTYNRYLIVGFGLGYHVQAFLELDSQLDIVVYEPNVEILSQALRMQDLREVLQRVLIISDVDSVMNMINDDRRIVVYRPELSYIYPDNLRNRFLSILERQESIKDHEMIFAQNFYSNIINCDRYVDEIAMQFCDKKVVIVAGGPSLDKNVDLLVNKPDDVLILAVGTVYRLLQKKNIAVDYYIFSDVHAYHQIQDEIEKKVPVLVLATADRRIALRYSGVKYLICQNGYENARNYAVKHDYMCYNSGGSVATLALDVAIQSNAKEIAFIGLDLAYYGTKAHASGTAFETFDGSKMQSVEAWTGEALNTSKVFNNYREWMERRIQQEDVTMPIIDATEGGAKKEGFVKMSLEEFLDR